MAKQTFASKTFAAKTFSSKTWEGGTKPPPIFTGGVFREPAVNRGNVIQEPFRANTWPEGRK